MTVITTKATDDNRAREAAAIDRITSPLDGGDFDPGRDHRSDALVAFWRRGSRDATFASCAQRGTWDDALSRLVFSGTVGDAGLPLQARQNVSMFCAISAWRCGMHDAAAEAIVGTPGWQDHRGLTVLAAVVGRGMPFGEWEAAMRQTTVEHCLAFSG